MNAREPRPVPYSLISRQAMRRDLPRPISWWLWHAVGLPDPELHARMCRAARLLCRVSRGTKYLTPAEACVVARRASWAVAHAEEKEIARLNAALVTETKQATAARELVQRVAMLAGSQTRDADAVFAHAEIGRIIRAAGLPGYMSHVTDKRHEGDWTVAWSSDPAQLVRNLADVWARAVKAEKRVEELEGSLKELDSAYKHAMRRAQSFEVDLNKATLTFRTWREVLEAARAELHRHYHLSWCNLNKTDTIKLVYRISAVLGA